ncbi:MAG: hypothetical protein R2824_34245 [Saprospiraceae bacterium]
MVNLLGAEGHTGPAYYEGLEQCLALLKADPSLRESRDQTFRKMGHVTILADQPEAAMVIARQVKQQLRVIAKTEG